MQFRKLSNRIATPATKPSPRRAVFWSSFHLCLFAVCFAVSACAPKDPLGRQAITGQVKLDGIPLDKGSIRFVPTESSATSAGPVAAVIDKGAYAIPAAQGLPPGTYQVVISSPEQPPVETDPIKAMERASATPVTPDRIPPQYNVKTTLTIEVKAAQPGKFDFDLKSK